MLLEQTIEQTILKTQATACNLSVDVFRLLKEVHRGTSFSPPKSIKSFLKFKHKFSGFLSKGIRSFPEAVAAYLFLTFDYVGLDAVSLLDKQFTVESIIHQLPRVRQLMSDRFMMLCPLTDLLFNYELIREDSVFQRISKEFTNQKVPEKKSDLFDYMTKLYKQLPINYTLQNEVRLRVCFPYLLSLDKDWVNFKQKVQMKILPHYDYRLLLLAGEAAGIFLTSTDSDLIVPLSHINGGLNDIVYFFHFCWKYMENLHLESFVKSYRNNYGIPDASKLIMKYLEFLSDIHRDILPIASFTLRSKDFHQFLSEYIDTPYGAYKDIKSYLKDYLRAVAGKKSSQVVIFLKSRLGKKAKQYLEPDVFSKLNQAVKQITVVTQDEAEVLVEEGSAILVE